MLRFVIIFVVSNITKKIQEKIEISRIAMIIVS